MSIFAVTEQDRLLLAFFARGLRLDSLRVALFMYRLPIFIDAGELETDGLSADHAHDNLSVHNCRLSSKKA
jgi:hypothetical protein